MEDANAVMLNLMEIGRALCDDEISEKRAGLLLYQQQLGLIAMKGLTFKETDPDLMTVQAPEEPAGDERRRAKKVGRELTRRNTNREKRVSHKATRKRADQGKERSVSGSNAGIARRKAGFNDSPTPGLNRVNPMNSGLNGEGHGGLPKMPKLPKSDDCFEN
jgi:hypothetical protein